MLIPFKAAMTEEYLCSSRALGGNGRLVPSQGLTVAPVEVTKPEDMWMHFQATTQITPFLKVENSRARVSGHAEATRDHCPCQALSVFVAVLTSVSVSSAHEVGHYHYLPWFPRDHLAPNIPCLGLQATSAC